MTTPAGQRRGERAARGLLYVWVFALVLVLAPFTEDPAGPPKILVLSWLNVLFAGACLLGRDRLRWRTPGLLLLAGFLGINLIAALAAPGGSARAYALHALHPWFTLGLGALMAARVTRTPEHAWRLIGAVVLAVACSSVYALFQHAGLDPFPWAERDVEEYRALPSTYANPNLAGHVLVMALVLGVGRLLHGVLSPRNERLPLSSFPRTRESDRRSMEGRSDSRFRGNDVEGETGSHPNRTGATPKLVWGCSLRDLPSVFFLHLLPLVLIATHLYLTHMRAAQLALMAALAFAVAYAVLHKVTGRPAAALGVIVVLAALAAVGGAAWLRQSSLLTGDGPLPVDSSLVLRANGYLGAARMVTDHPVLGVGPGRYKMENAAYWTDFEKEWYATKHKKNDHVHCTSLEVAADSGLLAAACYFALLAWLVFGSLAGGAPPGAPRLTIAACAVAFAVDGLFGYNLHAPVSGGLLLLLVGVVDGQRLVSSEPGARRRSSAPLTVIALLLAAVSSWTYAVEYMIQKATVARALGGYDTAAAALNAATLLLPWDARAPHRAGRLARAREEDGALKYYGLALSRDASHRVQIEAEYADLCLDLAERNDALGLDSIEAMAEAARADCDPLALPHLALGRLEWLRAKRSGNLHSPSAEAALEHLRAAAVRGPRDLPAVLTRLGDCARDMGRTAESAEAYRLAALANPADASAWERLAGSGAAEVCRTALHETLARLSAEPEPDMAALETVALAVSKEPGEREDPAPAAAALYLALRAHPEELFLWRALARAVPQGQRLDVARYALSEAGAPAGLPAGVEDLARGTHAGRAAWVDTLLGDAHASEENDWLALLLEDSLSEAPLEPEAQNAALENLAVLLSEYRCWHDAMLVIERLGKLPGEPGARLLAAHARCLLGQDARDGNALGLARSAVKRDPAGLFVRITFARALAAAGRTGEARFEYDAILKRLPRGDGRRGALTEERDALEETP